MNIKTYHVNFTFTCGSQTQTQNTLGIPCTVIMVVQVDILAYIHSISSNIMKD